jgi:hypothetical protein
MAGLGLSLHNYAMALDAEKHKLFMGIRFPGRLMVMDTGSLKPGNASTRRAGRARLQCSRSRTPITTRRLPGFPRRRVCALVFSHLTRQGSNSVMIQLFKIGP